VYIYIYIYVCVCVCVFVCGRTSFCELAHCIVLKGISMRAVGETGFETYRMSVAVGVDILVVFMLLSIFCC